MSDKMPRYGWTLDEYEQMTTVERVDRTVLVGQVQEVLPDGSLGPSRASIYYPTFLRNLQAQIADARQLQSNTPNPEQ